MKKREREFVSPVDSDIISVGIASAILICVGIISLRRVWTKWLGGLAALVIALTSIILFHELLLLAIAFMLRSITAAELVRPVVRLFLSSPVYSQLMLETLGGIDPQGVAIAGLPGRLLHQGFSPLFLDPQNVTPGALVSAIVDRNSTVLSILVTRGLAEAAFILFGGMIVRTGWRRRDSPGWSRFLPGRGWFLVGMGLYIQAQSIHALVELTLSPASPAMRDTGIGFGLSRLLGLDIASYESIMDRWLPITVPVILVAIGFLAAWIAGQAIDRARAMLRWRSRHASTAMPVRYQGLGLVFLIVLTQALPWSHGYFNLARYNVVARAKPHAGTVTSSVAALVVTATPPIETPAAIQPTLAPSATATSTVLPTPTLPSRSTPSSLARDTPVPTLTPTPSPTASPTPVPLTRSEIRRGANAMELYVNGKRTIVTGVNYNVNYTGLAVETKRALHRRDFKLLRDAGANSLIGWGVYDEATLEAASEYNIGVVMPFELDPKGSYENEGYRENVKVRFRAFLLRYKSFPAVWGWNPGGDELLHRMDTEEHRTTDKLQAAADLLVEMSALAYSIDPDRISMVKEPRDWYIPYLDVALTKERARPQHTDPARYFVFALNVYGQPPDVREALNTAKRNAEERLDVGMVVGEYAPFGLPRQERAIHYATIWDDVLTDTPNGGFVYVFGPDQPNPQAPNPYDPMRLLVNEFSLVDIQGKPVDDTLSTLAARWQQAQLLNQLR